MGHKHVETCFIIEVESARTPLGPILNDRKGLAYGILLDQLLQFGKLVRFYGFLYELVGELTQILQQVSIRRRLGFKQQNGALVEQGGVLRVGYFRRYDVGLLHGPAVFFQICIRPAKLRRRDGDGNRGHQAENNQYDGDDFQDFHGSFSHWNYPFVICVYEYELKRGCVGNRRLLPSARAGGFEIPVCWASL